jgi:hypothetical protein
MAGDIGLETRVPARLSAAEGRKFGLVVGGAFLALAAVLLWRDRNTLSLAGAVIGGLLIVSGLLIPTRLGPVQRGWMGLAHAISKVTTPIFMGIVFFLVITPIGLLMRTFGHRPLVHGGPTAWFARTEEAGRRSNLQRQF